MFQNPSIITRIAIGKSIGFVLGLIGIFVLQYFWPESSWMEQLAFLFWYTTMGAFIGVFGVLDWHPVLRLPMPWWFRSTVIGGWMNFVLTLFIYDRLAVMMTEVFGENGLFLSPFWFVAEGVFVGLIIGFFATRFGGEGSETIQR